MKPVRPADLLVFRERGPITELHDGTLFPATAQVSVLPGVKKAITVDMYLEVDDGDPVVTHLVFGRTRDGAPLTTSLLRTIDVDDIRRQVIHALAYDVEHQARLPLSPADHDALVGFEGPDEQQRRRRRIVNDDLLRRVAAIYREAESGGAPTQAVEKRLNTSLRNASRYVKTARERGLL